MGRKIPLGEVHPNHPLVYLLFLTASVAAIISIVSSLCGLLERIKGPPDPPAGDIKEIADFVRTSPSELENVTILDANHEESTDKKSDENILEQSLPPPPAMRAVSCHNLRTNSMAPTQISRSNSSMKSLQRKLSTSMSMKALLGILTQRHEKVNYMLNHEDSIWKKQIILGEKCKVPDQDEDDTIIFDENGNRISTYHPKQLNDISMSRQSSQINANAFPK